MIGFFKIIKSVGKGIVGCKTDKQKDRDQNVCDCEDDGFSEWNERTFRGFDRKNDKKSNDGQDQNSKQYQFGPVEINENDVKTGQKIHNVKALKGGITQNQTDEIDNTRYRE